MALSEFSGCFILPPDCSGEKLKAAIDGKLAEEAELDRLMPLEGHGKIRFWEGYVPVCSLLFILF